MAALNGPAYGGGFALALACDLRIAAESSQLCAAFIKTGLTATDIGISYFLPRLIGASWVFDLMLTGRTVDADAAERLGIVLRTSGQRVPRYRYSRWRMRYLRVPPPGSG